MLNGFDIAVPTYMNANRGDKPDGRPATMLAAVTISPLRAFAAMCPV
jgi:hypothetical protein